MFRSIIVMCVCRQLESEETQQIRSMFLQSACCSLFVSVPFQEDISAVFILTCISISLISLSQSYFYTFQVITSSLTVKAMYMCTRVWVSEKHHHSLSYHKQ